MTIYSKTFSNSDKVTKPIYLIGSLFSGCGGFDMGFQLTDTFRIVFANDIRKSAVETFSQNFGLPVASVGEVVKDSVIDVLIRGPPCQDFSIIRGPSWDRQGVKVRRGKLYTHFARALILLQPKIFVFENVPGLISANKGNAYKLILRDFSNLNIYWNEIKEGNNHKKSIEGYYIMFSGVVDASKIGVSQARQRLFIIGVRKDVVSSKIYDVMAFIKFTLSGQNSCISKYPITPLLGECPLPHRLIDGPRQFPRFLPCNQILEFLNLPHTQFSLLSPI